MYIAWEVKGDSMDKGLSPHDNHLEDISERMRRCQGTSLLLEIILKTLLKQEALKRYSGNCPAFSS